MLLEDAVFQALIQKCKAVALPIQCFDPVSSSAAEEKQRVAEGIQMELLLHDSSQAIYSSAQIGIAAGNIYPVGPGKIA